jgi:hypothetical protein
MAGSVSAYDDATLGCDCPACSGTTDQACRACKHVAEWFHVGWDTVKQIDQRALCRRLGPIDLSDVRVIAIDEFAIQRGLGRHALGMKHESGRRHTHMPLPAVPRFGDSRSGLSRCARRKTWPQSPQSPQSPPSTDSAPMGARQACDELTRTRRPSTSQHEARFIIS